MVEKGKKLGFFSAFCVLIIASVFNFESAAINPALATIGAAFPGEPQWKLTFISTIPFITSIIFSTLCGKFVEKVNKKWLVVFALALYGIVGMMPGFVNDLNTILVLRLITGIGVGLCMPIPAMIIAEHYAGEDLKKMNGRMNAVFNVANGLISICVGAVAATNYRNAFYAFAFMLVVMVLVIIGCPDSKPTAKAQNTEKVNQPQEKVALPAKAVINFVYMFLVWIAFSCVLLSLANLNMARGMVPMTAIGIFCALPGVFNAIAALAYPKMEKLRGFAGLALIILALGLFLLGTAHGTASFVIACALIGFGHGLLVPYLTTNTAMNVPAAARDKSLSLVQTGIHTGALIATFVINALLANSPMADAYQFAYTLLAVLSLAGGIIFGLKGLATKK